MASDPDAVQIAGRLTQAPQSDLPAARGFELGLELFLPLVQGLKAKLPAMELDAELVDVARDLGPLRFVLFELMRQIGNPRRAFRGGFDRYLRHGRWFAALLTIQRHPSRSRIDHERGRAI